MSYGELQQRFSDVRDYKLVVFLDTFKQSGIVFHKDDCYLSLLLRCNIRLVFQPIKEEFMLVSDEYKTQMFFLSIGMNDMMFLFYEHIVFDS